MNYNLNETAHFSHGNPISPHLGVVEIIAKCNLRGVEIRAQHSNKFLCQIDNHMNWIDAKFDNIDVEIDSHVRHTSRLGFSL